jgi:hypothetical protein
MKPIDRAEVLGLADYEIVRERFRGRVIGEKRLRRVQLGPRMSAVFENRDTVLLQIQEMLRTERITRPAAIEHEIETYNELIPGDDELSFTLLVEIPDKEEREAFLRAAVGLEGHVWLVAGDARLGARSMERHAEATDRTTAVHYMKIALPHPVAEVLREAARASKVKSGFALEIDHPAYVVRVELSPETLGQLADDLRS